MKSEKGKQEKPGKGERKNYLQKSISRLWCTEKVIHYFFNIYCFWPSFGEYFLIYYQYGKICVVNVIITIHCFGAKFAHRERNKNKRHFIPWFPISGHKPDCFEN